MGVEPTTFQSWDPRASHYALAKAQVWLAFSTFFVDDNFSFPLFLVICVIIKQFAPNWLILQRWQWREQIGDWLAMFNFESVGDAYFMSNCYANLWKIWLPPNQDMAS